jgi:hypothetical protein
MASFWFRLHELEYTEELMSMYLREFVDRKKNYGRDISAFSDLTFDDIFLHKPGRLYQNSWVIEEKQKASRRKDHRKWDELEQMYVFAYKGDCYHSFHNIPTPPGMITLQEHLENQKEQRLLAQASSELILQESNPSDEEDEFMKMAQENFKLKAQKEGLENMNMDLRKRHEQSEKQLQRNINMFSDELIKARRIAAKYASEVRQFRNQNRLVMKKGMVR